MTVQPSAQRAFLTVAQLTHAIKNTLEQTFSVVSVQGEVSNLKEQSSGHIYFTLKDREAQISCVLFKGNARQLSRLPKDGDQIIVRAELTVYALRGNYQLLVRTIEFSGVGELLLRFQELKTKLQVRGWFDPARKRPLPKFPKVIGVVTSPTGAVIQDILTVLKRRVVGFHLILNPVKVQGDGAKEEIARAIEEFNRFALADILIVGRGGGSIEDLFAFNEEIVAHAIFHSAIPIISAIGHETDFSIADFVADVRAPTPSAAAEIAMQETARHVDFLKNCQKRLHQMLFSRIREEKRRLEGFTHQPALSSCYAILGSYLQKMDDAAAGLQRALTQKLMIKRTQLTAIEKQLKSLRPHILIEFEKEKLLRLKKQLTLRMSQLFFEKKEAFKKLISHLKALDPKNLLSKGYCLLFAEKDHSVILSSRDVEQSQKVSIRLHDGKLTAKIAHIEHL